MRVSSSSLFGSSDVFSLFLSGRAADPFRPRRRQLRAASCISRPAPGSQSTKIVSHRRTAATTAARHSSPHHAPNLRGNERRRETEKKTLRAGGGFRRTPRKNTTSQHHRGELNEPTRPPHCGPWWGEQRTLSHWAAPHTGRVRPRIGPASHLHLYFQSFPTPAPPRPCYPRIGSDGH